MEKRSEISIVDYSNPESDLLHSKWLSCSSIKRYNDQDGCKGNNHAFPNQNQKVTHLLETDIRSVFTEASTAQEQAVLSDQAVMIEANTTESNETKLSYGYETWNKKLTIAANRDRISSDETNAT